MKEPVLRKELEELLCKQGVSEINYLSIKITEDKFDPDKKGKSSTLEITIRGEL